MENSIKSARKVQKVKLIFSKKKTKLCLQFYSSVRLIMSTFKLEHAGFLLPSSTPTSTSTSVSALS